MRRRTVLAAGVSGAAAMMVANRAEAVEGPKLGRRQFSVVVATNEPWGTYHSAPMLAEMAKRGWKITQVVPDLSKIGKDDPVPVATLDRVPWADVVVINGAEEWPVKVARQLWYRPLVASSLAYLNPSPAPLAGKVRYRLRTITASSPAEADTFAAYLGLDRVGGRKRIKVVGSPQTDNLPQWTPKKSTVLIITSVTKSDETGGSAPGARTLLATAARLKAAGKRVVVGLHPREDPALWADYEISPVGTLPASANAEVAVGIPGTIFPMIAAVGVPLVGVTDPALKVPTYLRDICSARITSADQAIEAVRTAKPAPEDKLAYAVGPIGGSAARLANHWRYGR